LLKRFSRLFHGEFRVVGNVPIPEIDRQRLRLQTPAIAAAAGTQLAFLIGVQPGGFLAGLFLVESGQRQARTKTALAPAVL